MALTLKNLPSPFFPFFSLSFPSFPFISTPFLLLSLSYDYLSPFHILLPFLPPLLFSPSPSSSYGGSGGNFSNGNKVHATASSGSGPASTWLAASLVRVTPVYAGPKSAWNGVSIQTGRKLTNLVDVKRIIARNGAVESGLEERSPRVSQHPDAASITRAHSSDTREHHLKCPRHQHFGT